MKKSLGIEKKRLNMIPFLIVMAVIPWSIVLTVTYLLYRRVKPQLRLLWATVRMAWVAQRAAQATPKVDPDFPKIQEWSRQMHADNCRYQHDPVVLSCSEAMRIEDPIREKREELAKAQENAGFKLIDADHVIKKVGNA
jgi:hypothetical protein